MGNVIALPQNIPPRAGIGRPGTNADVRDREYLTPSEMEILLKQAKKNRWGVRDHLMVLVGYLHGLRVSELVSIRWGQLDLETGVIYIKRKKGSISGPHPLSRDEIRGFRKLWQHAPAINVEPRVFLSERGSPLTTNGFFRTFQSLGVKAGFPFPIHPHMLRHSCGFKLANEGQDTRSIQIWLGHKGIQHTEHYTQLSVYRFRNFHPDYAERIKKANLFSEFP